MIISAIKKLGTWAKKTITITDLIFSGIFAAIFTFGHYFYTLDSVDVDSGGTGVLLGYGFAFFIMWVLFLVALLYIKQKVLSKTKKPAKIFLKNVSDKRFFILTTLTILIFYLPIIVFTFSTLTVDSWNSIGQIRGTFPLDNSHPIIFTLFVGLFIKIGLLFGSLEFGTLLFSLAQSAMLAAMFAYVLTWMRKQAIRDGVLCAAFIFYAVLPINAMAGIIMWKDILFAGFGLLFLMYVRQLFVERNNFFTTRNIISFIILAFLFCTFRNNGFYAYVFFIITLATMLIFRRKNISINIKRLSITLLTPFILFGAYSFLVSAFTNTPEQIVAYGLPIQQIARTVRYHGESISSEDKAIINEIFVFDDMPIKYNPGLHDPVRNTLNYPAFSKDKVRYASLWARLGTKHKQTYLAAFIYNSYGYFYPYYPSPTTTDIVFNNKDQLFAVDSYNDTSFDSGRKRIVATYRTVITDAMPLVNHIGTYVCLLLLGLYIGILKKMRELTGVLVIMLGLLLTTILGPVNSEFRYLYMFVLATPFILVSVLRNKRS